VHNKAWGPNSRAIKANECPQKNFNTAGDNRRSSERAWEIGAFSHVTLLSCSCIPVVGDLSCLGFTDLERTHVKRAWNQDSVTKNLCDFSRFVRFPSFGHVFNGKSQFYTVRTVFGTLGRFDGK
jgi:hypothetical protein